MRVKYYVKPSGRSPVEEFLLQQSEVIRTNFLEALNKLANHEVLQMPLSRNLYRIHKGLHELRLKDRSGQFRFFSAKDKGVINAFKRNKHK